MYCCISDFEAVREEGQVPIQRLEQAHAAQQEPKDRPEVRSRCTTGRKHQQFVGHGDGWGGRVCIEFDWLMLAERYDSYW